MAQLTQIWSKFGKSVARWAYSSLYAHRATPAKVWPDGHIASYLPIGPHFYQGVARWAYSELYDHRATP